MARSYSYFKCGDSTSWTYTSADVEFLSKGLHLKATKTGSTSQTPAMATTGWSAELYRIDVVVRENIDTDSEYSHRFLVSFDGGTTYKGPLASRRLVTVAIADISTDGFTASQLAAWRDWPTITPGTTSIMIAVRSNRTIPTSYEAEGYLEILGVIYGTDVETVDAEPDGCDKLPYGDVTSTRYLGPEPDFPMAFSFIQAGQPAHFSDAGFSQGTLETDFVRYDFDHQWSGRDGDEIDTLETFLAAHHDRAFEWTPPGETAPLAFIAPEPFSRRMAFEGNATTGQIGGFRSRWIQVPHASATGEVEGFFDTANSRYHLVNASNCRAYQTFAAPGPNLAWYLPFAPATCVLLRSFKINVTVASAGGGSGQRAYFAIYESWAEDNPIPRTLVSKFADDVYTDGIYVSTASTGVKTASVNLNLSGGKLYWIAFGVQNSFTMKGLDDQGAWPVWGSDITGQDIAFSCVRNSSFTAPFGATATAAPTVSSNNILPAILLEFA